MRVVVVITETGSPELYRALHDTPPRLRAERLRTLATVGLVSMSNQVQRDPPSNARQDVDAKTRIGALARKLGGAL